MKVEFYPVGSMNRHQPLETSDLVFAFTSYRLGCMNMPMLVCTCVCTCKFARTEKTEVFGIFFNHFHLVFFEAGPLDEPGVH